VKYLGSLWLTVAVLVVLAAILIAATWASGYDVTVGSLRRDFYGSWWFNILLGLLAANLIACTVRRKPWKFWQWGFLVTHAGVLTLMIGAAISFNFKIYGHMPIREGSRTATFEIEGEREIVVRTTQGEQRFPLEINPYVASRPKRVWSVGGSILALEEYLPNVGETYLYESVAGGRLDVLEIRTYLEGRPLEPHSLIAGHAVGNGLLGFKFVKGGADLYRNLTGEGILVVTLDGETREIPVRESLDKPVSVGKRQVTVRRTFGSFSIGEDGKPEENADGIDANPAVAFEVRHGESTQMYYAFALYPEISPMRRGGGTHASAPADFAASFRYAPRQSMVWFFALDGGIRYVITTVAGEHVEGAVRLGERIRHPRMPMGLHFEVVRRVENAEPTLREEPPRKGRPARPALRVRAGDRTAWVRLDEIARMGEMTLHFAPKMYRDLNLVVELVKFRNPPHEGTGRASKFESDLRVHDPRSGGVVEGKTGVNYPFSHRGWTFYQSGYNDQVHPPVSILQVSFDPGKRILYLGFMMAVSGSLFMVLVKRKMIRLVKAPPSGSGALRWLVLGCGPIAALLLEGLWGGLAAGSIAAGAGLLVLLALAGRASDARSGRMVSAAWCLNTAALAVFMFLRVT